MLSTAYLVAGGLVVARLQLHLQPRFHLYYYRFLRSLCMRVYHAGAEEFPMRKASNKNCCNIGSSGSRAAGLCAFPPYPHSTAEPSTAVRRVIHGTIGSI